MPSRAEALIEAGDFAGAFEALCGVKGPDFKLRERDPRQDMQYGESLMLCVDPAPYRAARRSLEKAPRSFARELLAGIVEAILARFEEAETHLDRAAALDGKSPWPRAWRGVARAMACRRKKSQEGLREALMDLDAAARGAAARFVYPWRAELRHDLEDMPGALSDLDAILREGANPWARVERGEILCETGRHDEALEEFDRLVRENPDASWALAQRGRTLATTGKERRSLADLRRAVALDPRSASAKAWLAESLRRLGRYREALALIDGALKNDPRFVLAWIWRGRIKLLLGRYEAALRDLDRAIRLDPRYHLAFAWRGEALFKLGRIEAAEKDFARVAPMDPSRTWNPVLREGEKLTPESRRLAFERDYVAARRRDYRPQVAVMAAMAAGRKRVDAGDMRGAIRRFDEAVGLDPACAQAFLYRAGLKLVAGDDRGALEDFRAISRLDLFNLPAYRDLTTLSAEEFPALIPAVERVLNLDPNCAWAHVFRAFSLRSLMRYEEAVKDLDRAVACEPRSAALRAMRSRVKLTNRQALYDGVRDMEAAVALAPDWGWLHCWLGEALRHRGKYEQALAALDRGLALDPRYLRGHAWRGGVLVALGRYREAIKSLTRSLAFDAIYHYEFEYVADQKSWAYNQRMLARRGLSDVAGALKDLNEAHRFGPRYNWVFNPKGEPRVYERGIAELTRAIERAPRLAWAWAWRGWTFHQWGKQEEALSDLAEALRLSPKLAWPWSWRGRVLLSLGEPEQALECLDRALKLDPSDAQAWGWRAEARRLRGKLPAAVSDFTEAIRLDHRAAWAFAGRGECRRKQGRLDESLRDLDRALAICPDYAEALGWRAETRRLMGNLDDALRDSDEALKLNRGLVLVYVTRALVKQVLKDYAGQLRDFRAAARLDPALLSR